MWQYSGNSPTAAMYSTVHRSDFRRVYPCIKPMVSLNRFWMSSILLIFLACSSSRIFALRSFSSGLRFFLPIVKTSDVVLLFYTTSKVYTKLGIVPFWLTGVACWLDSVCPCNENMLILRRSLPILADGAVFSCHCAVLP